MMIKLLTTFNINFSKVHIIVGHFKAIVEDSSYHKAAERCGLGKLDEFVNHLELLSTNAVFEIRDETNKIN